MILRIAAALVLLSLAVACAKDAPEFEEVAPADELFAQGQKTLEGTTWLGFYHRVDYGEAIETFQAIIDNYPYSEYAVQAEIAIADAYFDDEKYEEALSYYRDFTDLHPQNERVPYSIYRSALCHARRAKATNRDQTATRDALIFLDHLLAKYPYSEYAGEGEILWRELRTNLAENVGRIGDFYLKRSEWESAAERFRSLLNEYPGLGLDAEALYKLGVCYAEMNRIEEAQNIFQAIVQNYQQSDVAKDAAEYIASLE